MRTTTSGIVNNAKSGETKVPEAPPGHRLWVEVRARLPPDAAEPPLTGPQEQTGAAFIFALPFDVFCDSELSDDPRDIVGGPMRVRIFPPFSSKESTGVQSVSVKMQGIPYLSGTTDPGLFPGEITELTLAGRRIGEARRYLRLDIAPTCTRDHALWVANRFLSLVRGVTGQWWIGRDRSPTSSMIRNVFPTNSLGERLAPATIIAFAYGLHGFEKPLTNDSLNAAASMYAAGRTLPLSFEALYDGVHAHSAADLRRATIDLAIAMEASLAENVSRLVRNGTFASDAESRIFGGNSFLRHVKRFERTLGASFPTSKEGIDWIRALWAGRGAYAHGLPPMIPTPTGARLLTDEDIPSIIEAVRTFLRWLAAAQPK